jgi:hypothetical protein
VLVGCVLATRRSGTPVPEPTTEAAEAEAR